MGITRRSFLKFIGIVAGTATIAPTSLLASTDEVEKKVVGEKYLGSRDQQYIHTIKRPVYHTIPLEEIKVGDCVSYDHSSKTFAKQVGDDNVFGVVISTDPTNIMTSGQIIVSPEQPCVVGNPVFSHDGVLNTDTGVHIGTVVGSTDSDGYAQVALAKYHGPVAFNLGEKK